MNLVEIKASFDATNVGQLSAAISFLSSLGVATETKQVSEPQQATQDIPVVDAEEIKPEKTVEKPKKRRRTKAEIEAEKAPKTEEAPKTDGVEITLDEIRSLTAKKAKDHREAIKSKITEWNANNVAQIPQDKYPAYKEFLNGLS